MQKRTRSLLEELDSMYVERERDLIIESRASNIIAGAINLLEQVVMRSLSSLNSRLVLIHELKLIERS
jgi:hypothetical protein